MACIEIGDWVGKAMTGEEAAEAPAAETRSPGSAIAPRSNRRYTRAAWISITTAPAESALPFRTSPVRLTARGRPGGTDFRSG